MEVRPLANQIDDLMEEVRAHAERGERVLVTTLTKRTAEDLSDYLRDAGLRVEYLHSDIDAIERVEILRRLRQGEFDCLVGINLLREGLDLPEVALVAILDADKEGFLRSETSLIQVAGRTARHVDGKVILYADAITDSMRRMMDVTRGAPRDADGLQRGARHHADGHREKVSARVLRCETNRGEVERARGPRERGGLRRAPRDAGARDARCWRRRRRWSSSARRCCATRCWSSSATSTAMHPARPPCPGAARRAGSRASRRAAWCTAPAGGDRKGGFAWPVSLRRLASSTRFVGHVLRPDAAAGGR